MLIEFILKDDGMPRTIYWQTILDSLGEINRANILSKKNEHTVFVCHEDTAMELNWPRYDLGKSAYTRGTSSDPDNINKVVVYINTAIKWAQKNPDKILLLFNNHPFFRITTELHRIKNIYIADVSLSQFEHSINQNTISIPAFALNKSSNPLNHNKKILACFQGVASHPIRSALAKYNNDNDIIIKLIEKNNHPSRNFSDNKEASDITYKNLFQNSNFAFIPRGDALFSYRLLEAMSFGCIPIILSDGWVLPFSKSINWSKFALLPSHDNISKCIDFIKNAPLDYIEHKRSTTITVYDRYFKDAQTIIQSCLYELQLLTRHSF